jgi:hypothetical protein
MLVSGTFFPERKYISMLEMLVTVDHATNFLDEFEQWQIKYQRSHSAIDRPDEPAEHLPQPV